MQRCWNWQMFPILIFTFFTKNFHYSGDIYDPSVWIQVILNDCQVNPWGLSINWQTGMVYGQPVIAVPPQFHRFLSLGNVQTLFHRFHRL